MIARAFKHTVHKYLRQIPPYFATSCIAHLLNCLLGSQLNDSPKVSLDAETQSLYPESDWSFLDVTPSGLQRQIVEQVHRRYRFDLAADWTSNIKHLQLLREISLKLGLQLTARDYCFKATDAQPVQQTPNGTGPLTNGTSNGHGKKKKKLANHDAFQASQESLVAGSPVTFEADDIVNLVPIVKEASPKSSLAEEAFEAGKAFVNQDQKELGQELLLESLSLHEQIYGILHPEVARVYHQLATLYYQLHDQAAAVELARKAVIVSERTLGADSAETVLAYLNLGFFEHAAGRSAAALRLVRHALDLWKLVHGAGLRHPDAVTTLNNAAVMLQQLRRFRASRRWFERSLAVCDALADARAPARGVAAATLRFQLAQALALDHEPQRAVAAMRDAYGAFRAQLGPDDRNTKEAEAWLEQLTQNAVSIARHAKDVQSRRVRRIHFAPSARGAPGLSAARLQPPVGDSVVGPSTRVPAASGNVAGVSASALSSAAAGTERPPALDARSLDELIRFIEGGPEASKRSPGKKRAQRGHPKRRGGTSGQVAAAS